MRRVLYFVVAAAMTLAPVMVGQKTYKEQPAGTGKLSVVSEQGGIPADSLVLHTTTQLVLVDVLVRDRNGNPVHGLSRDQLQVTEDRSPQTLRSFEEFSGSPTAPASTPSPGFSPAPVQPPGTFVVDGTAPASGPLYILLVDALNTPTNSQDYLRQQLRTFLQHTPPGMRVAVFGLNGHLMFLQGFTADPTVLLHAVEQRMPAKSSVLLDDPNGTNEQPELLALIKGKFKGDVEQGGRTAESFALETRLRLTMDAFSTLGRYLSAFPGHKNLLWFSGSFPMNLIPDPGMPGSSESKTDTEFELRRMTNALARAQVSLYPVDARGIVPSPAFDAGCHCGKYVKGGGAQALKNDTLAKDMQYADEHSTMDTLANQTGGQAFYQTNNLAAATTQAFASGANYYTLSYVPANHDWNGAYREIRVKLSGAAAAKGYTLSYRRGYYATDPNRPAHGRESAMAAVAAETEVGKDRALALALLHGAPAPADLPFKVRILPASRETEDKVVPGNHLAPGVSPQGPFQRYAVDFLAPAQPFTLTGNAAGQRTGAVRLVALVYDAEGKLLNSTNGAVPLHLSPDEYTQFLRNGVPIHIEISVPAKREAYLRVALEDEPSSKMGALEIALAEVSHLDPPVAPEAASATVPAPPPTANPRLADSPADPSLVDNNATELASAATSEPSAPAAPAPPAVERQPDATPTAVAAPLKGEEPFTLHVYEQVIQVPTLVLNGAQTSYRNIRPEGFWVQLDGGPAFHPRHVHVQSNDPISLAVLLDLSGSSRGATAAKLPTVLPRLRPDLLSPNDHLSVFAYDCSLIRSVDNAPASAEALRLGVAAALASPELHARRGACTSTHPLLSTVTAVVTNMQKLPGRRVLLVVSDRTDAGSPELLRAAWRFAAFANVTVFGIRPPPQQISAEMLDVYRIRHQREDAFADVCAQTGGLDVYSTPESVATAINDVVGMVRNRYILEFQRPARGNAGEHEIAVRVLDSDAMIRIGTAVYPGKDGFGSGDPNTLPSDLSQAPVYGDRTHTLAPR